jgi:Ala-tRNA(Pro) deacylase
MSDLVKVLARIEALLADAPHSVARHEATFTAEAAAAARGTPLAIGGKSLVMKVGDRFALFVLSGAAVLHGRKIQKHLRVRRLRFASRDELMQLTGLEPGCVPPFGAPIFDLPLYVDPSITANDRIAFNPGAHTVSMVMQTADYLRIAQPEDVFKFTR